MTEGRIPSILRLLFTAYRPLPAAHRLLLTTCCLLLTAHYSLALGPHEILLLANKQSPRSLAIARDYAALRQIPQTNLVELDLPAHPPFEISPAEFSAKIWTPARQLMHARRLDDHILAWVYSVDFPLRITATPALSIHGLTFLRNRMPSNEQIENGTYASPIFAGPESPRISGFPAQSLDAQSSWLGQDMPLPSMMLGYMGPNGNTRDEIMACLKAGVKSDRSHPTGTFLIVTNADLRTLCRTWEFEPVIRELRALGIDARLTAVPPPADQPPLLLTGVMTGAAELPEIGQGRFQFHPGAIAEHLTSFGAAFDHNTQTKITAWIRAGATATAGTVTEPMSNWAKFPHARVFAHQVSGCTTLESLIQSIRSPLQILLIGEPLATPWGPRSTVTLKGLPSGSLERRTPVTAEITAHPGETFNRFLFLLDGQTFQKATKSAETTLDPAALTVGHHQLRVVAYKVGPVRAQIFYETSFEVK